MESDEVAIKKNEPVKEGDKKTDEKKPPDEPKDGGIDFDGLEKRVTRVPLDANNYFGLAVKSDSLIYGIASPAYYGRAAATKPALRIFAFKDRKETTLTDDVNGFTLSHDRSKVLVRQGQVWNLYDATPAGASSKKTVSTGGLMVEKVPADEWKQIFNEVWRRYRDFFYAPNMHGYDWEAVRERYSQLLPYVAHRSALNYVIGEMISELTVQHAYIDGAICSFRRVRTLDCRGRGLRSTPVPDGTVLQRFSPARTKKKTTVRR
jgi:tricorn protease